jgi:hypothetical protein
MINLAAMRDQATFVTSRAVPVAAMVSVPEIAVKGPEERELLLAPGTRVRIDHAEFCGGKWFILATALS